jgi:hypothetical protein
VSQLSTIIQCNCGNNLGDFEIKKYGNKCTECATKENRIKNEGIIKQRKIEEELKAETIRKEKQGIRNKEIEALTANLKGLIGKTISDFTAETKQTDEAGEVCNAYLISFEDGTEIKIERDSAGFDVYWDYFLSHEITKKDKLNE